MLMFIFRRFIQTIPVVIGVTFVVFFIMQLVPGDPAVLLAGEGATKETIAGIREQLGLNRPLFVQYFDYLIHIFQGDFGLSLRTVSQCWMKFLSDCQSPWSLPFLVSSLPSF